MGKQQDQHRAEVERLFDGLVTFSRSVRTRAHDWGHHTGELSRTDIVALGVIAERGSCRPGAIAEHLGVGPSVISRQLAALQRMELVSRAADPLDGRAELVTLTDAGRTQLVQARAAVCDRLGERLAGWETADLTRAADVLAELSALLLSGPTRPAGPDAAGTPDRPGTAGHPHERKDAHA